MNGTNWRGWLLLAAGILAPLALAGCPSGSTGAQTRLSVMTMDSRVIAAALQVTPQEGLPTDATEATIHVDRIRLVPAGEEGQEEPSPIFATVNLDLDLLDLSSQPVELAEGTVPAGDYTSFGLIVSSGTITFTDQHTEDFKIPSGGQVGLRFQQPFTLPEGTATVTLDWNSDQSIHRTTDGRWNVRPTSLRLLNATGQEQPQEVAQASLSVLTMDSSQAAAAVLQVAPQQGLPADATAVTIHVDEIRLVPASEEQAPVEGLQDEPPPDQEPAPIRIPVNLDLDLLTLSDTPIELAEGTVPAGDYTIFGLIVSSGQITFADQHTEDFTIPSGGQVGLRFQQPFTLPEGAATVTVDWNSDQSIHRTGQGTWIIRPTSLRFLDATGQEQPQEPEQPVA